MALTVRNVVESLYRYLRKDQRTIPHSDVDIDDPLPEALACINGTLQELAALAPIFGTKQSKAVLFRAPESVTVTGATQYGYTADKGTNWDNRMLGCRIALNGESEPNRILSISTTTATLQNPILGASATGSATVSYDAAELPANVIAVLEPVRFLGGDPLRPSNGRFNLTQPVYGSSDDYGGTRLLAVEGARNAYFVESYVAENTSRPKLRMMLRDAPTTDKTVEYQARVTLGYYETSDVYGEGPGYAAATTAIPIPSEFVESIFLPLVLMRWFGSSVMRNTDAPQFIAAQAATARQMLERMNPQTRRPPSIFPAFG